MSDMMTNLGARLMYQYRVDNDLTQCELSELTDGRVSQGKVSRYEKGVGIPGLDHALLIEETTGIPVQAWKKRISEKSLVSMDIDISKKPCPLCGRAPSKHRVTRNRTRKKG